MSSRLGLMTKMSEGGSSHEGFLRGNKLEGALPSQLGQLVNMETCFGVYANSFSQEIPTEVS